MESASDSQARARLEVTPRLYSLGCGQPFSIFDLIGRTKQKKHRCGGLNLMYSTSSLVAWLLFEFESELSLSHQPSTRFETTFRISDHLAEKTPFAALIEKQPADCIRLSDYLFTIEIGKRTCVFQWSNAERCFGRWQYQGIRL